MTDRPVLVVAGARPNFVKVAPILAELDRRHVANLLVHTGQHYEAAMSERIFADLGMREPDVNLEVGSAPHAVQTARIMEAFEPVLEAADPSWVVVVGDVNSTMACALVAAKTPASVAHVEAGLRSGDRAMPEEINRIVTDRVSDLLLAPSDDAVRNLEAEGADPNSIVLVGNVMVDSLLANLDRARALGTPEQLGLRPGGFGLLTLHRPSNVDDPRHLGELLEAVVATAGELPIVYPAHPRVRQALAGLAVPATIRVIEPVGYLEAIGLQAGARLVLTDSGGLQEESTVLGVPCLTLRTSTERPVTISEGTNELVGVDPAAISAAVARVLREPPPPRRPALWDGHAAVRVVEALLERR